MRASYANLEGVTSLRIFWPGSYRVENRTDGVRELSVEGDQQYLDEQWKFVRARTLLVLHMTCCTTNSAPRLIEAADVGELVIKLPPDIAELEVSVKKPGSR